MALPALPRRRPRPVRFPWLLLALLLGVFLWSVFIAVIWLILTVT